MAHQSLYRAYRPKEFKDVIGQDEIVGPLKEQIASEKVGHAYLFAGSRGLGKTSIARIFARELGTVGSDLYEIDAASHNKVDNIRELNEGVHTLPFSSKYKVYILDEVHMLSPGAWNAFLKTLEEPPPYALFILATTELQKVPETVQSRCQVFHFKKPTRAALAKLVADVAKKEGYTLEPSVADLVALLAEGSYRDSLSVLEKVLSVGTDKKITREEAERATGAPRSELVSAFVLGLAEKDKGKSLEAVRRADEASVDMQLYLALVLDEVRNALLVKHALELRKEIKEELGAERYGEIEKLEGVTHEALKALLEASSRMRYSPVPALSLELAVYELLGQ